MIGGFPIHPNHLFAPVPVCGSMWASTPTKENAAVAIRNDPYERTTPPPRGGFFTQIGIIFLIHLYTKTFFGYNKVLFYGNREGGTAVHVNQIRAGAVLSYLSMGLSTIISLVYTPIMLQQLGDSEFGVYQAVLPIISYLNLLSFGLGSAYVRYYSRFRAAGDKQGCAKLNGMFLLTYLVLGVLVLVIGFGLSCCDVVFGKKLTAEEIDLAQKLLRILTVNAALTFPISVFESHVTINEQYLFQKLVAMGKQVLNPLIMIPLLLMGYRSVMLTFVSLAFTIVSGVINVVYCLGKLKMPFSFRKYDFGLLREMFGFTLYVFIGIVVDNFNWSIDRLLLTWIHGSTAVTVYVIASQLNTYYLAFGNAISNVMTPRVHRLVAENAPMRQLDALFTRVGRLQFILLGGIFLGFVAIGQSFVVLWGGGEQFRVDYWTAMLLLFACLWPNIQTVGIEIQRAKNMHKYRSLVYLGVAVSNAIISIPLAIRWEGLGAAIGTVITTLIGNVFLMNRYYHRHIGLNIPAFWRHIGHLLPAMALPTVTAVLLAVFVHPASYWELIPPGCLLVAVYGLSMWLFGMNRYERSLITGPLRRVVGRLHR